jgi:DNA invertase Pin-like site-specific DNA recombinase
MVSREAITAEHLQRLAYLYTRQSTPRQVMENTESARRQRGLQSDIEALGWTPDMIRTVDEDQGRSGASATGRSGFQKLLAEVASGRAGLVAALEASRLARDNADWAHLVKLCALTGTLILDGNGLYDPRDVNDGIILDVKGTISKMELQLIVARCQGAIRSKAKRGEFRSRLPAGFVYDLQKRTVLDPDLQVQQAIRVFFDTFRRLGSARQTVREIRKSGLRFPVRTLGGSQSGEIRWTDLTLHQAVGILHNPRYAGAYFYGRMGSRWIDGKFRRRVKPREKWLVYMPGAHEGYISLEEYERNLQTMMEGHTRTVGAGRGPPREGRALLQGLVLCGRCGQRMTVAYRQILGKGVVQYYKCMGPEREAGEMQCQLVRGDVVDLAVSGVLLEVVTPMMVDLALEVQRELEGRETELDHLRRQEVERIRYETNLAERRYRMVDPENRMVALSLERGWEEKLRELTRAEAEYRAAQDAVKVTMTAEQKAALQALPTDLAGVWQDPRTPPREKKRMARLVVEDVTLTSAPGSQIAVGLRLKGGDTRTLSVPLPGHPCRTSAEVIEIIGAMGNLVTDEELANELDRRGLRSGTGKPFTKGRVGFVRRHYFQRKVNRAGGWTLDGSTSIVTSKRSPTAVSGAV